jgi:hypothetical protein
MRTSIREQAVERLGSWLEAVAQCEVAEVAS